jgi:hypothetical protein
MPEYPPNPVRVLPIGTSQYHIQRPGAIAFLGISGMLVAIFGAMFSAYLLLVVSVIIGRAGMVATATTSQGVVWSPTQGNLNSDTDAMRKQARDTVLAAMDEKQRLTPRRHSLMNSLLRENGQEIITDIRTGFTKEYVAALISEAGKTEDGVADYFILPNGRVQVSDESATFRSRETNQLFQANQATLDAPGSALTAAEIDRVLSSLKGSDLTVAQRAALPKYLADSSQQLIAKRQSRDSGLAATAYSQDDVTMIYGSTGSWIQMDAHGNVIGTSTKPTIVWGRGPAPKVPAVGRTLLNVESLMSILLSVGLFIVCLGALRYAPKTRGRFRLYALLKIPILLVGTIAVYQVTSGMGWSAAGTLTVIYLLAGAAFPVLVLILMQTSAVRNYFTSHGQ